jgi:hypothetical protein
VLQSQNGTGAYILGDREKPRAERAAKLILVYYVPPKRCQAGIPPCAPKQKRSSLAPGFSRSPVMLQPTNDTDESSPRVFDHEEFKNIASGIQSLIAALGIIIGGILVVYNFWTLGTTNKARAEIAILEHNAVEQPVLQLDMQPTTVLDPERTGRLISVSVKLRNDGKRIVKLQPPSLLVSRLRGCLKALSLLVIFLLNLPRRALLSPGNL